MPGLTVTENLPSGPTGTLSAAGPIEVASRTDNVPVSGHADVVTPPTATNLPEMVAEPTGFVREPAAGRFDATEPDGRCAIRPPTKPTARVRTTAVPMISVWTCQPHRADHAADPSRRDDGPLPCVPRRETQAVSDSRDRIPDRADLERCWFCEQAVGITPCRRFGC
jgi:hypothetical protein